MNASRAISQDRTAFVIPSNYTNYRNYFSIDVYMLSSSLLVQCVRTLSGIRRLLCGSRLAIFSDLFAIAIISGPSIGMLIRKIHGMDLGFADWVDDFISEI